MFASITMPLPTSLNSLRITNAPPQRADPATSLSVKLGGAMRQHRHHAAIRSNRLRRLGTAAFMRVANSEGDQVVVDYQFEVFATG